MNSLVNQTQPQHLNNETARLFLNMGMLIKNNPCFSNFFQQLKKLKLASDVIQFIFEGRISIQTKIHELFAQIGIQISEEQNRRLVESPIDTFNELKSWCDYFTTYLDKTQQQRYRETYQGRIITHEDLISFSKSLYSNDLFRIFIKTLNGRTIEVQITNQTSIEELKSMIVQEDGIPDEQKRLIFAGRQLENSRLVGMYNIVKDSQIHLVLALRGGMHHNSSTGGTPNDYFDILRYELSPILQVLLLSNI